MVFSIRCKQPRLFWVDYIYGRGIEGGGALLFSPHVTSTTSQIIESSFTGVSPSRRSTRGFAGSSRNHSATEPTSQYEVKPDGSIARMRCPKCGAHLFRSMLGFLNHCRIHCRLVFSSQDERLQRCGVLVDPSEIPPDYFAKHPTVLKREMDLAVIRADVIGPMADPLRKPMINVEDNINCLDNSPYSQMVGLSSSKGEAEGGTPQSVIPAIKKESRYYIKRKIIIGNAAKVLPRSPEIQQLPNKGPHIPSHKWRIYVKTPRSFSTDLTMDARSFIKGVRIFLHPSYKPNSVVDVVAPNASTGSFELTRSGWGEFPVRVQLHFWDPRNKPIELVHFLRILTATGNKYIITAEQIHEIEIDRKTQFKIDFLESSSVKLPPPIEDGIDSIESYLSNEDLLSMVIDDFPLAANSTSRRAEDVGYQPIQSIEEFLRLNLSSQKSHETKRAKAIWDCLTSSYATFSLSVEDIILWCRTKGHTPASVATLLSALGNVDAVDVCLLYCRFCGLPHLPQDRFEVLQRNCSLRPRKIHLSSRTTANEMMSKFNMLQAGSESVKRLKQELLSLAFPPYYADKRSATPVEPISDDVSDKESLMAWVRSVVRDICIPSLPSTDTAAITFISGSMISFLHDLLKRSITEMPELKERTIGHLALLTPLHIYRAIMANPSLFDFLGNAFMAGGTKEPDGKG